jgi:hypothetical protein
MKELTSATALKAKCSLFLVAGSGSAALLLQTTPHLSSAALLVICVWSLARAYYFAFYVIEHYIDSSYRFSGLGSAVAFLWRRRHASNSEARRTAG